MQLFEESDYLEKKGMNDDAEEKSEYALWIWTLQRRTPNAMFNLCTLLADIKPREALVSFNIRMDLN